MAEADVPHDAGELDVRRGFFGHPVGLGTLSLSYSFERFAFYGMQSLLALYMSASLLVPGHAERVWGLSALARMLGGEGMSREALASAIYGLYIGLCYTSPLVGGIIADRLLGRTPTIILGACILVAGHFLMAFEPSFLIALGLLLTGIGLMKGNVATQVGALYAVDDLRRTDAFQIFIGLFQIAGILAPLICGTLGEKVGWHYGFTAAGVSMVIALALYLATRRYLPPDPPRTVKGTVKPPPMTPAERRRVAVLLAIVPVLGLASISNDQIYNAYILWGARSYQRTFFGFEMPASWLGSLDTIIAFITSFLVIAYWRWQARYRPDPDEITKLAIGSALMIAATLVLAAASAVAAGGRVSLWWAVLFETLDNVGTTMIYAIGMAMFSRAAPRQVAGLIIGIFYLHLMVSNLLVGWIGGWLGTMPDARFWLIHSGLTAVATGLILLFRALFRPELAPA